MTRPLALVLVLASIAFAIAPIFTPEFTGYRPGQFPVEIARPAIQPAGYAFSIWGVIYAWLILHAGYGFWKRREDPAWIRVRPALLVALLLGIVWLAIAVASPIWATVVILVMAGAALVAFLRAPTEPDRWLLSAPLGIFAGWLTAAASVSTGVLIGGYGLLSNTGSALAMLTVVLVIALVVQSRKPRMPVYSMTVVWALVGVIVANRVDLPLVAWAAAAGAAVMLGALVLLWRKG